MTGNSGAVGAGAGAAAIRIREADLQDAVLTLARYAGYLAYHTYDSRRSAPGFPDAILVHPGGGNGRLIAVEFKSARGRLSPAQQMWLAALAGIPGVECYVWRPADWLSGRIEAILLTPLIVAGEPTGETIAS